MDAGGRADLQPRRYRNLFFNSPQPYGRDDGLRQQLIVSISCSARMLESRLEGLTICRGLHGLQNHSQLLAWGVEAARPVAARAASYTLAGRSWP
jgi:hypothetical protein